MTDERKAMLVGKMHMACTQIRLAIAVLEEDVPEDEKSAVRLERAKALIDEVKSALA